MVPRKSRGVLYAVVAHLRPECAAKSAEQPIEEAAIAGTVLSKDTKKNPVSLELVGKQQLTEDTYIFRFAFSSVLKCHGV